MYLSVIIFGVCGCFRGGETEVFGDALLHASDGRAYLYRKLIFLARNNADEQAKRRLMPIVRDLIHSVAIGMPAGHQSATLLVHGLIASILAQMDVMDRMERQFMVAAQKEFEARIASGEIDTEDKKKKLLDAYAEELLKKFPEWENLQMSVVAGAGFEPAAFRL